MRAENKKSRITKDSCQRKQRKIREIPKEKRVYVDEAGFDTYLYRKYAIEPRGQKIHEAVNKRTSIVAGKIGHKILAPQQYSETKHADFFLLWFEEHFIPARHEDVVIILDNASFHRKKRLYDLAERHHRTVIFLPPDSPELNPIEHFWQKLQQIHLKIPQILTVPFLQLFKCGEYIYCVTS